MSPMTGLRVVLVGPLPPPLGGMAAQTSQLADLLRKAGAEVVVVRSNVPHRPTWIARVPIVRAAFRLLPYLCTLWRTTGSGGVVHVMANSGWSWHLFAAPAVWIGWMRRVPVIVNYRGGEAGSFLARSASIVRWTMRRVARLIVPSGFLQQIFDRHRMPAHVVPNIVDLQRFRPRDRPADGTIRLVVARNLEAIYDIDTALRAFEIVHRRFPQARMTVAGTGPESERLQALAASLGIADCVTFAGRVERDDMAALLAQCDLMINPSRVDNMPNSILEALACGTPVVSTRVGGVPFMVEDGIDALLVPAGEPSAMAEAVQRLIDQPALRASIAAAGLKAVRRYTWERVGPVLADVYVAAQRGQPA